MVHSVVTRDSEIGPGEKKIQLQNRLLPVAAIRTLLFISYCYGQSKLMRISSPDKTSSSLILTSSAVTEAIGARRLITTVPIRLFNHAIEEENTTAIDMFGIPIGPQPLPDMKQSPRSPEKKLTRRSKDRSIMDVGEEVRARQRLEACSSSRVVRVNILPELNDLLSSRAQLLSLELVPDMVRKYVSPEVRSLHGTVQWPERSSPRFLGDMAVRGSLSAREHKPSLADFTRRSGIVQATPAGMLPPDRARHDQRDMADRVFTCRQHFALRSHRAKESAPATLGTPVPDASWQDAPRAAPAGDLDLVNATDLEQQGYAADSATKPSDAEPHGHPAPAGRAQATPRKAAQDEVSLARRAIEQKLFDARYEPDGRGGFALRPVPRLIPVPPPPRKPTGASIERNRSVPSRRERLQAVLAAAAHRDERLVQAARRRQEQLAQRQAAVERRIAPPASVEVADVGNDAAGQERQRRAVERRQRLWLRCEALARSASRLTALLNHMRAKAAHHINSARVIQRFVRIKMLAVRFRRRVALLKLAGRLTWMVANWRARRKIRAAHVILTMLQEQRESGAIRRAMAGFLYGVRRLQRAFRARLLRDAARLAVLSRQWDRAYSLLRTSARPGRGAEVPGRRPGRARPEGPTAVPRPPPTQRPSRVRSAARRSRHGSTVVPAADDPAASALASAAVAAAAAAGDVQRRREESHRTVHVELTRKQYCQLLCLRKAPALKRSALRAALLRLRVAHLDALQAHAREEAAYAEFQKERRAAEAALRSLLLGEDAADPAAVDAAVARRLVGSAWRRSPPVLPRFCPVLPAPAVQMAIVACLAQIAPSSMDDLESPPGTDGDAGDPDIAATIAVSI